jgi:hypothetical protein
MTEKQDHKENFLPGRFCISLVEDSLLCFERIVENPHATNVLELWLIIHPLAKEMEKTAVAANPKEKVCCLQIKDENKFTKLLFQESKINVLKKELH